MKRRVDYKILKNKKCTKCKNILTVENFRLRKDKRCIPVLEYLNPECKNCEKERTYNYYHNKSKNTEWVKNHNKK